MKITRYIVLCTVPVLLLIGAACCLFRNDDENQEVQKKTADYASGKEILMRLGTAAQMYSVKHGGNGETKFPTEPRLIAENLPPVIQQSICDFATEPKHINGYLAKMRSGMSTDDFCFEVFPAPDYAGKTLIISKDMVVREKLDGQSAEQKPMPVKQPDVKDGTEKKPVSMPSPETLPKGNKTTPPSKGVTESRWEKIKASTENKLQALKDKVIPPPPPPPVIQPANPQTAKELLQSLHTAAMHYSVMHGGNGQKIFPAKATQIRESIPPVIKRAIVFVRDEEDKAVPVDGYILVMYPSKAPVPTDDFCFVAYPAPNYSGDRYEIDKAGKVTKISR